MLPAVAVDMRHKDARDAQRLTALDPRFSILETNIERERRVDARHQPGLRQVSPPYRDRADVVRTDPRCDLVGSAVHDRVDRVRARAARRRCPPCRRPLAEFAIQPRPPALLIPASPPPGTPAPRAPRPPPAVRR